MFPTRNVNKIDSFRSNRRRLFLPLQPWRKKNRRLSMRPVEALKTKWLKPKDIDWILRSPKWMIPRQKGLAPVHAGRMSAIKGPAALLC
jgi:hypothetical protein